jgi:hypothetical protein
VRHDDVLRIFLVDYFSPSVGVTVRRVFAELRVFGDDDFFEIILRNVIGERTILRARNNRRNLSAQILRNALRRRNRFERNFVQHAVFMFDEY